MIVEYIRYALSDHSADELVEAYRVASEHLRAAPECLRYEVTQCEEEPSSCTVRIEWSSTQAHLEGFRRGPHFPAFFTAIKPFIPEIAEMRHYALSDVLWTRDDAIEQPARPITDADQLVQ